MLQSFQQSAVQLQPTQILQQKQTPVQQWDASKINDTNDLIAVASLQLPAKVGVAGGSNAGIRTTSAPSSIVATGTTTDTMAVKGTTNVKTAPPSPVSQISNTILCFHLS